MIIDVELSYYLGENPGEPGTWHAEWAPRGADDATEDLDNDLAALVRGILEDLGSDRPASVNWMFLPIAGDLSPDETKQMVKEAGVTLPTHI